MTNAIDVFVDLTGSQLQNLDVSRLIEQWAQPEKLGAIARRVTCVGSPGQWADPSFPKRPGWVFEESGSSIERLSEALAAEDGNGIPLLLILGPVDANCEAVRILGQCLERSDVRLCAAASAVRGGLLPCPPLTAR